MSTSNSKELHDRVLAEMPAGATHDAESCRFCAMTDTGGSVTTHTDEDLTQAVAQAVADATAPLKARITELEASQQVTEVEAAKAEIRNELQAKIDELQTELDRKVIEAQTAQTEADSLKSWLEGEKTAAEEAAALEARKEERLTKVKEVASFPDEYLQANLDRFAAMSDEDFEVALESWRQMAAAKSNGNGSTAPPAPDPRVPPTALHASREDEGMKTDLREVMAMRINRIDPATL